MSAPEPEHELGDVDARKDLPSRTRIAELEARWRAIARLLLIGSGAVVAGVVIAITGLGYLYLEVQTSRRDQAAAACLRDERQNRGIHRFVLERVRHAGGAAELEVDLAHDFPVIVPASAGETPRDELEADDVARRVCAQRARDRVGLGP